MSDKSFSYVGRLSYRVNKDGTVDLEQDMGDGNVERVRIAWRHLKMQAEIRTP